MTKEQLLKFMRENPGSPFILFFIISLLLSSGFISDGYYKLADKTTYISYLFFIIGVILQINEYLIRNK